MRILLTLLLSIAFAKADWRGDGNLNLYYAGGSPVGVDSPTNRMNILSNNITIAMWLKIRDTGTGLEQKNVFFSKGRLDFVATCNYLVRISGSKLEFNYTDQVGGLHTYQSSSTILWTNILRFVAITYTYTNDASMKMYIDGLAISGSWTSGNGKSNTLPTAHEFSLSGPTAQLVGGGILMGEEGPVMAWTTNLTQIQLYKLYKCGVHGLPHVIEPKKCIMYMGWDHHRAGVAMDARSRCADRSPANNPMPAIGGSSQPMGNRIWSFLPNE